VVKVIDILDFNGSFMNKIRDLVGKNPIILMVTKVRPQPPDPTSPPSPPALHS
jgi:nitric-oxide synthase